MERNKLRFSDFFSKIQKEFPFGGEPMYQPLADELRPRDLSEVYGQDHILGEGAILRRIIESGVVPNLIFYGTSGTGKTTVANIIAEKTNRRLFKLNATTASTADVKKIVSELDTMLTPNGVLLYLDEIQSFNKKQQQTLLEFIENGKITLIASTTENPYFYVFNAILSRSTIFEFKSLTPEACQQAVERAMRYMERKLNVTAPQTTAWSISRLPTPRPSPSVPPCTTTARATATLTASPP